MTKTGGLIGVAAQLLGVTRRTALRRIAASSTLQEVRDQAKQHALDDTEWALYKAARAGEPWAVQWFLRYQGKDRGYQDVHKSESEQTVRVQVDYTADALSAGAPVTTVTQLPPPEAPEAEPQEIEVVEAALFNPGGGER